MKLAEGVIAQWKQMQEQLRSRLVVCPFAGLPRWVAGADIAFSPDGATAVAAAVVYDRECGRIVESQSACVPLVYPYVPTYLSFREAPALLAAIGKLKTPWEVICFDGQGYAHPRRCGLATHMGVTLDRPAIGVGKSRLIGTFAEPGLSAGEASALMDGAEQIGWVLRTRTGVKPIFVSLGHRMDLESAKRIVVACGGRYRIPEPTRQADILTKHYRAG